MSFYFLCFTLWCFCCSSALSHGSTMNCHVVPDQAVSFKWNRLALIHLIRLHSVDAPLCFLHVVTLSRRVSVRAVQPLSPVSVKIAKNRKYFYSYFCSDGLKKNFNIGPDLSNWTDNMRAWSVQLVSIDSPVFKVTDHWFWIFGKSSFPHWKHANAPSCWWDIQYILHYYIVKNK